MSETNTVIAVSKSRLHSHRHKYLNKEEWLWLRILMAVFNKPLHSITIDGDTIVAIQFGRPNKRTIKSDPIWIDVSISRVTTVHYIRMVGTRTTYLFRVGDILRALLIEPKKESSMDVRDIDNLRYCMAFRVNAPLPLAMAMDLVKD